ncbi:MAG TPA: AI-2E family transporter [Ktedonobacterales bacterium]|nr:AI-2E family transporter [Ktedonobacterales bacterium]
MDSTDHLDGAGGAAPGADPSARRRFSITVTTRTLLVGAAIGVAILIGAIIVTQALGTLIALVLAIILGEAIRPVVAWLRRYRIPAPLAVLLIYVVGAVIFGVLIWLLLNPIISQINNLTTHLPEYLAKLQQQADDLERQLRAQGPLSDLIDTISQSLANLAQQFIPRLIAVPLGLLTGVFSLFINAVILLTMTLFWFLATDELKPFVVGLFPPASQDHASQVFTEIGRAFGGYIRGTLIAMLLIGGLTGTGLALLGVPYALLLGILAGFTELLPYLGPWISGTVSVLVALITVDPGKALQVILLFILIQNIEGNVIEPLVMSRAVKINPLVVIVAVLIGLDLLGIVGAILAVPVAAAIQIIILRVLAPAIRRSSAVSAPPGVEAMAVEQTAPPDASAASHPVTET